MRRYLAVLATLAMAPVACSSDNEPSLGGTLPGGTTGPVTEETSDGTAFDFTSTITITEDGFLPLKAVAVFGEALTFVNDTGTSQTISFTNGAPAIGGERTIGPIAPGGSMTYPGELATAISLVYEADGLPGKTGQLQIDPGVDTL